MCEVGQDEFIEQDHIIVNRPPEVTRFRHQPLNFLQNGVFGKFDLNPDLQTPRFG
jgi:hypothetical protein